ncbi:MAG: tyrosine-type recombinase/integrase [Vicinamibacterales bacterium]
MRIYRRGERWWVDFSVAGTRVREPGGDTRAEARAHGARRLLEIQAGRPDPGMTIEAAVVLYEEARRDRPERWGAELQRIASFVGHVGRRARVGDVTTVHVTRWIESIERTLAPATCRRHKTSVGAWFRWLQARGIVAGNPTHGAYVPTQSGRKKPALTVAEIEDVLARTSGPLHAAYMLAFFAGMRRGEIVLARTHDADHGRGTIHVRGRKTRGAEHVIPMHPRLAAFVAALPAGPIVARVDGGAYHPASIENLRRDAGAGLPGFHRGRHSLATLILTTGGSIEDVAAILRIKIRTAHEFYGWLVPGARGDVLTRALPHGCAPSERAAPGGAAAESSTARAGRPSG